MKIEFRRRYIRKTLSSYDLPSTVLRNLDLQNTGLPGIPTLQKIVKGRWWQWSMLGLALTMSSVPVLADETPSRPLAVMLGFESATGGDAVGSLAISSGSDTGDVKAGSGMHFYLGMLYKPIRVLEARLTAGYQMDRSPTSSGTVFMDRYTFEFTPTVCYDNHRFGAGVTYHTNIRLHANNFGQEDVHFKNSFGYTVEYGYKVAPFLFVGLRYVRLSYDIENAGVTLNGKNSVNANHIGINLYFQR